ncbi:hypothetical protein ERO13_D05G367000v2 [Gossypium hirsutum]|uniref:Uncharacterized protein isoform X1 n=2 Tax=Gossypium TaxID=3633 RepID=A0ABM3A0H0_GOSHI|nr:uncharacterized protein LOC107902187 isoform X1 [Gossypium hirsutum]KAG4149982.1 hypothetical protein ERO13_D05G367000v2 [Gossypium hirsutum]
MKCPKGKFIWVFIFRELSLVSPLKIVHLLFVFFYPFHLHRLRLSVIMHLFSILANTALYASVDKYLHGLFGLANDPAAEVRKLVCAAFVQLIEVRPSVMEPHMKNVIEYMLQVNKDTDDEVALEACEFWVQGIVLEQDNIDPMNGSTPSSKDSLLEEFFPDICLAIWTTTPWTAPANADGLCNECYEEMSSHVPTRRSYLLLPATIVPLETVLSLKLKFMLLLAGAVHEGFRRARWRIRSTCIPAC